MESYSTKIQEIKNAIQELIQELGDNATRDMLHRYFGLSSQEAHHFLELIDKLQYCRVPHDALPSPWFLQEHTSTSKVDLSKVSLREFAPVIRDQKREIIHAIRMFRSLEEEQASVAIEKWPEEYRKYLTKEDLKLDDDCDDSDGEEPSHNADDIADRILAKRWKSTPNTIRKYSTKKIANQVVLSQRFRRRQRKKRLGWSVRASGKRFRRIGNLSKPPKTT